jgi:hypothetical protein
MSEIEQRYVIKFLYAKKFGLDRILAELALINGEQADAKKAVEYWINPVKLGRSDMEDEAKHGRLPLDNADAKILACLSHDSFSSIRSIAQALGLALATVHRHLTISLHMRSRPFRWVPQVLTN